MTAGWAEIADLVHRYAALVDGRDLDAAADLFTDDAELVGARPPESLTPVAPVRGRPAIRAALDRVHRTVATMHGVLAVTVDPDTAEGVVSAVAHHLVRGKDGEVVDHAWFLRYRDRYAYDGRWRFARREIWIDWIETRPVTHWRDPHDVR